MLTKKDKKKRYNKKTRSLTGHEFGWGSQSATAWKNAGGSNLGGSISAVAGGIGGIVEAGMANAQIADTTEQEQEREARENWQSSANDNNSLLAEMASDVSINENTNWKSIRGVTPGQMVGNTLKGVVSGAGAGAKVGGPWGAVAGAAVGLAGGLAGIFAGNSKAQKKSAELNEAAKKANLAKAQTLTAKVGALDQAADARALAAYAAEGGQINPFPSSEFGSPITEFNAGGSHEENPYDGIPQGIAPDGLPNLVEEGEVKYDNYIFSDRLMLTKEDKKKYKFLRGKTYADAAKRIKKDLGIDERPNDLIAKTDLEEQLNLLSILQEEEREKRGLRGENRMMYAKGGHLYKVGGEKVHLYIDKDGKPMYVTNYADINQETWGTLGYSPYSGNYVEMSPEQKANWTGNPDDIIIAQGGTYLTEKGRMSVQNPSNPNSSIVPVAGSEKYFRKVVPIPGILDYDPAGGEGSLSIGTLDRTKADIDPGPIKPLTIDDLDLPSNSRTDVQANSEGINWASFAQAAPAIGNAIGVLTQAFNRPDYKHAEELQKSNETVTPIRYTPITQKLEYKPFDINYFGNKLAAQAGAARRAIREQSASNPYAAVTALLVADANAQAQLGDLYKKAEDHNLTQREKVNSFNRSTDATNAEMAMKAAQLNSSIQNSAYDRQAKKDIYAQQMKLAEEQAWSQAMSANMTGLFDNLGAMGKERQEQALAVARIIGESKNLTPEQLDVYKSILPYLMEFVNTAGTNGGKTSARRRKKSRGFTGID